MSEFARRSQENNAATYRMTSRYYARELARIRDSLDATADDLRRMAGEALENTRGKLK